MSAWAPDSTRPPQGESGRRMHEQLLDHPYLRHASPLSSPSKQDRLSSAARVCLARTHQGVPPQAGDQGLRPRTCGDGRRKPVGGTAIDLGGHESARKVMAREGEVGAGETRYSEAASPAGDLVPPAAVRDCAPSRSVEEHRCQVADALPDGLRARTTEIEAQCIPASAVYRIGSPRDAGYSVLHSPRQPLPGGGCPPAA